jgi:anaerobic magnesium-protoporphyrin IX monomethyl ester cyclase
MFKGAYTDRFYRAVRDALHAEVESWKSGSQAAGQAIEAAALWKLVGSLEPVCRNLDATELPEPAAGRRFTPLFSSGGELVPLQAGVAPTGDANE